MAKAVSGKQSRTHADEMIGFTSRRDHPGNMAHDYHRGRWHDNPRKDGMNDAEDGMIDASYAHPSECSSLHLDSSAVYSHVGGGTLCTQTAYGVSTPT